MSSIEFCAGAGGQSLGLELAGFDHKLLVDNDPHCCETLRLNRPDWNVQLEDMREVGATDFKGVDLFAAGLPCPPFSVAGKQLGEKDERNLFPEALRLINESQPKFVLIENVRGFLDPVFSDYRTLLRGQLKKLGYDVDWMLLNASDFGVSQLRPRVAIVAGRRGYFANFSFPKPSATPAPNVGALLYDLMAENGWRGAKEWANAANGIAPTIVGGSKKHGGPDLGPTRARKAWLNFNVVGTTIAEFAPDADFNGLPRLTTRMVARIQGFPDDWQFSGRKTNAYRQVGNAFPPPVAQALGTSIRQAILLTEKRNVRFANG
ncbi:MAG: DNA cytosine methyltransferase [Albidovulum sp.]